MVLHTGSIIPAGTYLMTAIRGLTPRTKVHRCANSRTEERCPRFGRWSGGSCCCRAGNVTSAREQTGAPRSWFSNSPSLRSLASQYMLVYRYTLCPAYGPTLVHISLTSAHWQSGALFQQCLIASSHSTDRLVLADDSHLLSMRLPFSVLRQRVLC